MPEPDHVVEMTEEEKDIIAATHSSQDKEKAQTSIAILNTDASSEPGTETALPAVPLQMKLLSVLLVSCIGFGSQWSSGVSGAMKSTIKKVTFYHPYFHSIKSIRIGQLRRGGTKC